MCGKVELFLGDGALSGIKSRIMHLTCGARDIYAAVDENRRSRKVHRNLLDAHIMKLFYAHTCRIPRRKSLFIVVDALQSLRQSCKLTFSPFKTHAFIVICPERETFNPKLPRKQGSIQKLFSKTATLRPDAPSEA
jgi:hypothetical protein